MVCVFKLKRGVMCMNSSKSPMGHARHCPTLTNGILHSHQKIAGAPLPKWHNLRMVHIALSKRKCEREGTATCCPSSGVDKKGKTSYALISHHLEKAWGLTLVWLEQESFPCQSLARALGSLGPGPCLGCTIVLALDEYLYMSSPQGCCLCLLVMLRMRERPLFPHSSLVIYGRKESWPCGHQ